MDSNEKRLYRSITDRRIGGVCGGLAEYFNIDSTIVRLLFVIGLLLAGGTFWAYVVMWIIIPEQTTLP